MSPIESSCIPANPPSFVQATASAETARGAYVASRRVFPTVCRGRGRAAQGAWEAARLCHSQVRRSRRPARGARLARADRETPTGWLTYNSSLRSLLSRSPSMPKTLSEPKGVTVLQLLVPGYPFRCANLQKHAATLTYASPTIAGQNSAMVVFDHYGRLWVWSLDGTLCACACSCAGARARGHATRL
jgi:hypothetical protein